MPAIITKRISLFNEQGLVILEAKKATKSKYQLEVWQSKSEKGIKTAKSTLITVSEKDYKDPEGFLARRFSKFNGYIEYKPVESAAAGGRTMKQAEGQKAPAPARDFSLKELQDFTYGTLATFLDPGYRAKNAAAMDALVKHNLHVHAIEKSTGKRPNIPMPKAARLTTKPSAEADRVIQAVFNALGDKLPTTPMPEIISMAQSLLKKPKPKPLSSKR